MYRFRNIPAIHVGPKGSLAQLERVRWRAGVNSAWDEAVGAADAAFGLMNARTVLGQISCSVPAGKPKASYRPLRGDIAIPP